MMPSTMFIKIPIWLFMNCSASQPAIPPMMMAAIQPICCSSIGVCSLGAARLIELTQAKRDAALVSACSLCWLSSLGSYDCQKMDLAIIEDYEDPQPIDT